jgi:hypothetical protein
MTGLELVLFTAVFGTFAGSVGYCWNHYRSIGK